MVGKQLKWWLVHGPERSGTTFMINLIASQSRKSVSDWGLRDILKLTPNLKYIGFDNERALNDICQNILDNAIIGNGEVLDLAFKQAGLTREEFDRLVQMWGEPDRKIFCIREPSSYMASVIKKFPHRNIANCQLKYIRILENYDKIGGDVFEYGPSVNLQNYIEFLKPLHIDESEFTFKYVGQTKKCLTTKEMWDCYHLFTATRTIAGDYSRTL